MVWEPNLVGLQHAECGLSPHQERLWKPNGHYLRESTSDAVMFSWFSGGLVLTAKKIMRDMSELMAAAQLRAK